MERRRPRAQTSDCWPRPRAVTGTCRARGVVAALRTRVAWRCRLVHAVLRAVFEHAELMNDLYEVCVFDACPMCVYAHLRLRYSVGPLRANLLVHTAQTYFRHLLFKTAASIQISLNEDSTPKRSPHLSKNRQRTVLARIQPQLLFIPSYSSRTVLFTTTTLYSLLGLYCLLQLLRAGYNT